ncbi:MAG TPA: adenylosuccinate synthase [Candidatus Norongarragalinales archaeon]|nr:adenylosuccinate synthase [Candidatus Norongarragalinales archaeon]
MPGLAIIGSQFGDEGKGKIVDFLAEKADAIIRFNGGNNAGHTVKIKDKEFKQHLLPSGVFHRGKVNFIASGVVVNPKILLQEMEALRKSGISISPRNLRIDFRAHLIMPWHILQEGGENSQKIGTTQRGIGPCYEDKAARTGIRFEDLLSSALLTDKLKTQYEKKVKLLGSMGMQMPPGFSYAGILSEYLAYSRVLKGYAADVSSELHSLQRQGKALLYEGAQGAFLDNNFGTYPFVTSSNCISAAAAVSCGVPPSFIAKSEGVVKAYTTRVGNGVFPAEISGELGEKIRLAGREFGTTTGRARRIGWLDLPMLRTAIMLNGFSGLHLTKLDVLAGLKEIKVATHYEYRGKQVNNFPADTTSLQNCSPVYRAFPGFPEQNWKAVAKKGKAQKLGALPKNALSFVRFIEKELKVPFVSVSVGPERGEIIFLR